MTDHVEASAILELVFNRDLELTNKEEYEKLVARVEFLAKHTRTPLSKLAVNTIFKIGGLALYSEYVIFKKGTKYVYFRELDSHEHRLNFMCKKSLDYEVYIPK